MITESARAAALRLLARREHSEQELVRKLERKGRSREEARRTVADLAENDLVSNERFTEAFVRQRVLRGYGPAKIISELKERGIDSNLIENWVGREESQWISVCAEVAQRKYRATPVENYREWTRRARYLQGRGFASEHIKAVLGSFSGLR